MVFAQTAPPLKLYIRNSYTKQINHYTIHNLRHPVPFFFPRVKVISWKHLFRPSSGNPIKMIAQLNRTCPSAVAMKSMDRQLYRHCSPFQWPHGAERSLPVFRVAQVPIARPWNQNSTQQANKNQCKIAVKRIAHLPIAHHPHGAATWGRAHSVGRSVEQLLYQIEQSTFIHSVRAISSYSGARRCSFICLVDTIICPYLE